MLKNSSSHEECALALSASAATNASPTSTTWPLSTLNFVVPHSTSLSTACSCLLLKKNLPSANLCEQHDVILKAMSSCCNVVSVLRSIIFTKCHIFSWSYLSRIPCTIFSFNISLMTSVTEVTQVRFCKVIFTSSCCVF